MINYLKWLKVCLLALKFLFLLEDQVYSSVSEEIDLSILQLERDNFMGLCWPVSQGELQSRTSPRGRVNRALVSQQADLKLSEPPPGAASANSLRFIAPRSQNSLPRILLDRVFWGSSSFMAPHPLP